MNARNAALSLILVAVLVGDVQAQTSHSRGLMLSLRANGAGWTVNDLRVDSERGLGIAGAAGYGISDLATVFAELSLSRISHEGREDYGLGHLDLGARFTLLSTARALRPYAEFALGLRTASWDDETLGTVDALGPSVTFGAGVVYFFMPTLAADVGTKISLGDLTDVSFFDRHFETQYHGRSVRLNLGLTWYPLR